MADYSIDDILAELDAKKSGNKSSHADTESETEKSSSYDISATSIIEGLGSNEITEDDDTAGASAEESYEPAGTINYTESASSSEDIRELTGEFTSVDRVLKERDNFEISDESSEIDILKRKADNEAAIKAEKPAEPEEKPAELVYEVRKEIVSDEEKRRMMLKTERENTNPDDMLALVNPLEVKEKVIEQVKEKELVSVAELSGMYAGNTQGIAGDDLKNIAPKESSVGTKLGDTADVSDDENKDDDDAPVKEYHSKKTTDGLIEKLNRNLAQQRSENVKAHRTITLNALKGDKPALQHPLNIDYQKQIIEATGSITSENPVIEEEKQAELAAAKKRKIKDFVLEDEE